MNNILYSYLYWQNIENISGRKSFQFISLIINLYLLYSFWQNIGNFFFQFLSSTMNNILYSYLYKYFWQKKLQKFISLSIINLYLLYSFWQNIASKCFTKNLLLLSIINPCSVSEHYILTCAVAKYWKYLANASLSHR